MGFRFGRSFKLPGGVRLNVSKRGIGASVGIKGLRFGTGPRGSRMTVSVPGTSIRFSSSMGNGTRTRRESPARSQQRALAAAQREYEKMRERERCAHEVAQHENQIALLTSMHREPCPAWRWETIAAEPAPAPPQWSDAREQSAIAEYHAYAAGFLDRLFGLEPRKRAKLAARVDAARIEDRAAYAQAQAAHEQATARWHWFGRVARGVLDGDVDACEAVITHLGPFAELEEFGTGLDIGIDRPWCVEAWFGARSPDIIPTEVLTLTATGKLSRKKMPQGRYWDIYQDHVCSTAFRIGRELFALLPIPVVFVHATVAMANKQTGQIEDVPALSVAFEREQFMRLDLDRIDPSDALAGFEHAMVFKKTSGFRRIDFLSPDDATLEDEVERP